VNGLRFYPLSAATNLTNGIIKARKIKGMKLKRINQITGMKMV
jgi:hypothetical protein